MLTGSVAGKYCRSECMFKNEVDSKRLKNDVVQIVLNLRTYTGN